MGLWYNMQQTTVTRGKMVTSQDLAYVAGFVDADGHIGICRQLSPSATQRCHNPRYQTYVVVTNCDRSVLEWMQAHFGGSIGGRPQVLPHHKPTYRWKATDQIGASLCREIAPYLRVKKAQAFLLIELCEAKAAARPKGKGRRLEPERSANYERIYQRFKVLNDDRRPQRPSGATPDVTERFAG